MTVAYGANGTYRFATLGSGGTACSGTHEVAFGEGDRYYFGSFTGGTACNDTVFGDPAHGDVKACYVQ